MASPQKLRANKGLRILNVGYPGTAKTGGLASLVNAGFKFRFLDFDGNTDPLLARINPEMDKNVDIQFFEDEMRPSRNGYAEPVGIPHAFSDAWKMLDEWKFEEDGKEINLGKSDDWGPDTILVLDSLTKMGDAAFRRAMKLMNKTPATVTDRVWGLAMSEQASLIEKLTRPSNRFHIIVLAHLKIIAPKGERKGDTPLMEHVKREIAELITTKLFPRALGYELPQVIGAEFPIIIENTKEVRGKEVKYKLNLSSSDVLDLKFPGLNMPKDLDISNGMLRVFEALSPESVNLVKGETK